MFKFNFDLSEDDLEDQPHIPGSSDASLSPNHSKRSDNSSRLKCFEELSLDHLLETLPSDLSYSPLSIPLSDGRHVAVARRDLFDARFQLIAQDASEKTDAEGNDIPDGLNFLEAPSDLVPGIYEGGLKTWECSLDLVTCLHDILPEDTDLIGQRILELGCGTAVPSMYLLQRIFSLPPQPSERTAIHLQDYNDLVFKLVTLPNLILTWYMSPASTSFQESYMPTKNDESDEDQLPLSDPSQPGELEVSKEFVSAFRKSLTDYGIELRFFAGSWQTFDLSKTGGKYDVVLTSETIYRTDSLPSLIELMRNACIGLPSSDKDEDESLARLSEARLSISPSGGHTSYLCLVAAKLVYFGVGGGVTGFIRAVEGDEVNKGSVETIWERKEGVKRCVMKVSWN
ncbi:unnamed protein product [Somion occarium]|uniref:protein-histidine N-methyltransferase n=1 Tax=Somion occarium TaxID=3059160 RepID=A0ABP1DLC7_9APHY